MRKSFFLSWREEQFLSALDYDAKFVCVCAKVNSYWSAIIKANKASSHLFPPQYLQPFSISLTHLTIVQKLAGFGWHSSSSSNRQLCTLLDFVVDPFSSPTTPPSHLIVLCIFFFPFLLVLHLLIDRILKLIGTRTCNLFSVFSSHSLLFDLSRSTGSPRDTILVKCDISPEMVSWILISSPSSLYFICWCCCSLPFTWLFSFFCHRRRITQQFSTRHSLKFKMTLLCSNKTLKQ